VRRAAPPATPGPTGQALLGVSPGAAGDVIVTVPTPQARGFTLTVEYR
jgi:hypothetical protein